MDEYVFDIILISIFALSCLYFSLQPDTFKVIPPYMPKACTKKEININKLIDEIEDAPRTNKTFFVEANYHEDYFDVVRSLNSLSDNNVVFNNENAEVKYVSSATPKNEFSYVDALRKQINGMNKLDCDSEGSSQECGETIKSWGYKKQFAKRNFKWEQQLEDLGLQDLYKDCAEPAPVDILVRKTEQNETNTQIQYVIEAAIHKISSRVNLVVKLTFVQQKGDPNTEFESAYIIGYEK